MSDLTLRKCNICLSEYIPLDRVVFFQCGHHACRACSERRSYREDPSCAECRKPKGLPHRIYLSSDDLVKEPAGRIVDELNGVNVDNSAKSIATVGERIRNLSGENPEISKALLAAAKDLEERVAPLAALYDEAKKQNQELLSRLQHLESASAACKGEVSQAKETARFHRDEELRLRERAKAYFTIAKEKNLEIERLQMELSERDKRENLMKTKLRALAKSQRHESKKPSLVGDISLQVEAKVSPSTKHQAPTVLQSLNSPLALPVKKRKRVHQRDSPSRAVGR